MEITLADVARVVKRSASEYNHGLRVLVRLNEAKAALQYILGEGYDHWIITFSGGKDSTATVVVSLEAAMEFPDPPRRIDVIYADTKVEIPVMHQQALSFLEYLRGFSRLKQQPLHCHVAYPRMDERFWVCLLGKGYPPPHQRFRWCTRRLKIEPVENALKAFIKPGKTVIITGVRFGESRDRDKRLRQSCERGGECGQGVWFQYSSRLKAGYLAPLVHWTDCDVWDFLLLIAPTWGYPTLQLEAVYSGRETRFGCWMCTVVRNDKTMEKLVSLPQWAHYKPLLEFRQRVKDLTSRRESRVLRPNGTPGQLTLEVRQQLLDELLELQAKLGMTIVSPEEIKAIKRKWEVYNGYRTSAYYTTRAG